MYVIVSYILCVTCDHNPSLGTMQTLKCTVVLYMHNLYSYCTCETSIRSFHSPVLRLFAIKNSLKTICLGCIEKLTQPAHAFVEYIIQSHFKSYINKPSILLNATQRLPICYAQTQLPQTQAVDRRHAIALRMVHSPAHA